MSRPHPLKFINSLLKIIFPFSVRVSPQCHYNSRISIQLKELRLPSVILSILNTQKVNKPKLILVLLAFSLKNCVYSLNWWKRFVFYPKIFKFEIFLLLKGKSLLTFLFGLVVFIYCVCCVSWCDVMWCDQCGFA